MDEKYFAADFPLANAKEVIRNLQGGTTKIAGAFVDPIIPMTEGPDAYDMFGVKPEVMDKTASIKHQLKYASEKTALLNQKIEDEIIMKTASLEAGEKNFIKTARAMVLEGYNSNERMQTLGYIYHFTKQAGYQKVGKKLMAKLAYVLAKEGMLEPRHAKVANDFFTKEADLVAPPELISQNLNVQIVNGTHPLYITLKTVGENEADLLRWNRDADFVQDKARILKQKIRAL
jgi:predicted nucleotidyltransferase